MDNIKKQPATNKNCVRQSIQLRVGEWQSLQQIASDSGSLAEAGDSIGSASWRTLLRRIALGELVVAEKTKGQK
jgi:hypothetical protein